jgi:hypothetical protein
MEDKPKHPGGRPRTYQDPEDMQKAVDKYFEENPDKPTMCGLAIALGFVSRQSLYDYDGYEEEFSYIIKKARIRVEDGYEKGLRTKDYKPTGPIFALKNMKWRDDKNIDHTSGGEKIKPQIVVWGADGDS